MLRFISKIVYPQQNKNSNTLLKCKYSTGKMQITQTLAIYAKYYSNSNKNNKQQFKDKIQYLSLTKFMRLIAILLCLCPLKKHYCQQNTQNNESQVQIMEIDKVQLVNLVHSRQEFLLMAFNKYQKNKQKQFANQISAIYNACKTVKVKKIYLVDKNDIKQLQKFSKWLKQEKQEPLQNLDDKKSQYFYINPQFESFPFFIQSLKSMVQQIKQIKSFQIKLNPSSPQFIQDFQIFNRTTIIKQCPTLVNLVSQNPCIASFKREISQLIQQSLLRKKQEEFKFYVIAPTQTSKLNIQSFHSELKSRLQKLQIKSAQQHFTTNFGLSDLNQKKQETFIFRYDALGKNAQMMSEWLKSSKNVGKSYRSQQKFIHFIKPRVFTISKTNYKTDLYWYVTCNRKNTIPTISIRNIDEMKTYYTRIHQKLQDQVGQVYQHPINYDLQMLRILQRNYPSLSYLIINTSIVAQLIRHLWSQNKYVIFNLSSKIPYEKLYLPNIDYKLTIQENFMRMKPLIQKFIDAPKIYDYVVMDKQHQIGREELLKLIQNQSQSVLLRVCYNKCLDALHLKQQRKLEIFKKLYPQMHESLYQRIDKETSQIQQRERMKMNKIYQKCYWINSQINYVGLQEGDYIFANGKFTKIQA